MLRAICAIVLVALSSVELGACITMPASPPAAPSGSVVPGSVLTEDQSTTLRSLGLVDDHPLYTMRYVGSYGTQARLEDEPDAAWARQRATPANCGPEWGCSLFAALGQDSRRLYGRNFDWRFSPALLLFTDPPDAYAAVSMVDMEYLGFEGEASKRIMDLSLEERSSLLEAPFLPFDGMNEKGLAIGMAAVPEQVMPRDPQKPTIDHLQVIREILDHAATVAEAIEVFGRYNIDMGNVPLHYLIADAAGDSAVVEFYQGEIVVLKDEAPWQIATNFLLASTGGHPEGQCGRYDLLSQRLKSVRGILALEEAFDLLEDVSQEETQWSVVYDITARSLAVVMDRRYSGAMHTFELEPTED